jgi:DUF971 family protein
MTPQTTPLKLNLKKDEKLEIQWQDGERSTYTVSYLRTMCPCAQCKGVRESAAKKPKTSLSILPGNFAAPIVATAAEFVGNYAIRIDWSDDHGSGIYSFEYLRQISPEHQATPPSGKF